MNELTNEYGIVLPAMLGSLHRLADLLLGAPAQ
jgi:hypothetical protein